MDHLFKPLLRSLEGADDVEEIRLALVKVAWNRAAGAVLQQHALVYGLREQTLLVAVSDGVWRQQLESIAGQLLCRLHALLGHSLISYIEFRIDPLVLEQRSNRADAATENKTPAPPVPFELLSAAASIRDPNLRRAFLGAACSAVRRVEEN